MQGMFLVITSHRESKRSRPELHVQLITITVTIVTYKTLIGNNSDSIEVCVQDGFFGYGGSNGVSAIFVA